jgi:hypothetical protein
MARKERWKPVPDSQDFSAADDYLTLILRNAERAEVIRQLKAAPLTLRQAKDLLRASQLPLLPEENVDVAKELKKVRKGVLLSPVLLLQGDAVSGVPMTIADGYHRICASYYLDETGDIPCLIADQAMSRDSTPSIILDSSAATASSTHEA